MAEKMVLETETLQAYFGKRRVLSDISLHVPEGKIYGFLGLNGAGKSTTIRIILGLLKAVSGTVRIFGEEVQGRNKHSLARVGSLVEAPGFYEHLSGADNLKVAQIVRHLPEAAIDEALRLMDLAEAGKKPVKHYSMGMKQRLGLAWALLGNPKLLVLDEPINGLDPGGVREVRDLLLRLSRERGVTVFLSSHILSEVQQLADRVGIIHEGRLVKELNCNEFGVDPQQTIRIRCSQASKIIEMSRTLDWVTGAVLKTGTELEARIPVHRSGELNGLLNRAGFSIEEFAWLRPDLEELFLNLTGGAKDVQTIAG